MRVGAGLYVWAPLAGEPEIAVRIALARTSPAAVLSGWTAAWAHGIVADFPKVVEVTVPDGLGVPLRMGMVIRRRFLDADDVVCIRGRRTTSICRTLRDLSLRTSLTEAVVLVDAVLHAGLLELSYLRTWIATRSGTPGIGRLRTAVDHAEPLAESAMETRLRMLLVLNGLPRPRAQVTLADGRGEFAGRIDLFYAEQRLGLEYDGATHRESLAEDNRRQNRLTAAGIRLLRFTAADLKQPERVAALVAAHLRTAA